MKNKKILIVINFIGSLFFSNLCSDFSPDYSISSKVAGDEDSLVNVIKQYSNITPADVNKYKLLWLSWFDIVPAATLGGYSMYKAYESAGTAFDYAQKQLKDTSLIGLSRSLIPTRLSSLADKFPEQLQVASDFLQTPMPWAVTAAAGAGLVSYKLFYPRIRLGVLSKVQNFLDLCRKLTVANVEVDSIRTIAGWESEKNTAICRAMSNLEQQGQYAKMLLNQVGLADREVQQMEGLRFVYYKNIEKNIQNFDSACSRIFKEEQDKANAELQLENTKAQLFGLKIQNVKNVLSIIKTVTKGAYNLVRDVTNFGIQHKEPLGMLGGLYWLYKKFNPTVSPAQ